MTYQDIVNANKEMTTTDIKGKDYVEVNQRVIAFRKVFPTGSIQTEMISNQDGVCVFKAYVQDENGNVIATGTAYEKESSTYINKTSYIENCETSAVGRALGFCGFGIDTSIASKEEVENAINNQEQEAKAKAKATQNNKVEEPSTESVKRLQQQTNLMDSMGFDFRSEHNKAIILKMAKVKGYELTDFDNAGAQRLIKVFDRMIQMQEQRLKGKKNG